MKQKIIQLCTILSLTTVPLSGDEEFRFELPSPQSEETGVTINFQDVSMLEFLRFVSSIAEKNFTYDERLLDFNISLVTGKATTPDKIFDIMTELLAQQGIKVEDKGDYYFVDRMEDWELKEWRLARAPKQKNQYDRSGAFPKQSGSKGAYDEFAVRKERSLPMIKRMGKKGEKGERIVSDEKKGETNERGENTGIYEQDEREVHLVSNPRFSQILSFHEFQKKDDFFVYKLQYHVGTEILSAIKSIAASLNVTSNGQSDLVQSINSMQWVQSTNSLLYSGTEEGIGELTELIQSLDVPKKQVFIEVLVIETDVKKGLEFGLEWGAGGRYRDKFGYGMGNFPATAKQAPFAKTMQGINATNTPTGADQIPMGHGFDLGVIGDVILHKGKSFFSLGTLVSALQADGDSTIVLNQKVIAQDNKLSRIFVGDNIAFTGSTVSTVGASQQTSANIEYRDVGVNLNITPLLGDGEMITLEIAEEITDIIPNMHQAAGSANGINTTKTDMATQVHVPDQSFLVLSGMVRNTKRHQKSGLPCLGGLPYIGAAFSKTTEADEKRNVIIFVRPQIVRSAGEYESITTFQENQLRNQTVYPEDFQRGIDMVKREKTIDTTSYNVPGKTAESAGSASS
ncbi:MAG: type II secretion system protein GspD [Chlamydiia bacterium]|nr:type II secretion system protein GspD [Chlamydiia bacterium]